MVAAEARMFSRRLIAADDYERVSPIRRPCHSHPAAMRVLAMVTRARCLISSLLLLPLLKYRALARVLRRL